MGLDIVLYDKNINMEKPSDKYPEHFLNKGYIRSAFNDASFNTVVNNLVGKDLYYIFDPIEVNLDDYDVDNMSEDEYFYATTPLYTKEHLEKALERAKEVLNELKSVPNYFVKTVETWEDSPVLSAEEALKLVANQYKNLKKENNTLLLEKSNFEVNHENGSGTMWYGFASPLKIVGVIPAQDYFLGSMKIQCVHLVYEVEGAIDSYIQEAEIVEEFLKHALTLKEPRIFFNF